MVDCKSLFDRCFPDMHNVQGVDVIGLEARIGRANAKIDVLDAKEKQVQTTLDSFELAKEGILFELVQGIPPEAILGQLGYTPRSSFSRRKKLTLDLHFHEADARFEVPEGDQYNRLLSIDGEIKALDAEAEKTNRSRNRQYANRNQFFEELPVP